MSYKCDKCGKNFTRPQSRGKHQKTCRGPQLANLECFGCGQTKPRGDFSKHQLQTRERPECRECTQARQHAPRPEYTCSRCGRVVRGRSKLAQHEKICARTRKRCGACKVIRDLGHFGNDRSMPDGLSSRCKDCNRAACRQFRNDNLEDCRRRDRERYYHDRESRRAYSRTRYKRNRPAILAYQAAYYRQHAEDVRARSRQWASRTKYGPYWEAHRALLALERELRKRKGKS